MKKLFTILLLLPVLDNCAASSGESSMIGTTEQPEKWWDCASVQDGKNGVYIETFMQDSYETNNPPASRLAARNVPWRLALKLKSCSSHADTCSLIHKELRRFEKEGSATQEAAARALQIRRMLINVSLGESGVRIRVEGEADPATFQTFFPPYTVVNEGNAEVTAEEKGRSLRRQDLMAAFNRFDKALDDIF